MEIDLAPIGCFEEAEFSGWINPRHSRGRLGLMVFHLALHLAHVILQLPPGVLECIVDCKVKVRLAVVFLWRPRDVDLAAIWQN
jgi:hypothetical protein